MTISSRTPEGTPNRCPICGKLLRIAPSRNFPEIPCPHCGNSIWFPLTGNGDDYSDTADAKQRADCLLVLLAELKRKEKQLRKELDRLNKLVEVQKALEKSGNEPRTISKFSPEDEKILDTALTSAALQKFLENKVMELSMADALQFWGLTQDITADVIAEEIEKFEVSLAKLGITLTENSCRLSNGRIVYHHDIESIQYVHRRMLPILSLLKKR